MNIRELDGKTFGIVFVSETEGGEPEGALAAGRARVSGDSLWVVFADGAPAFHVEPQWWERIRESDSEDRAELGVDYSVMLFVGSMPEGGGPPDYRPLGLQWPSANEK